MTSSPQQPDNAANTRTSEALTILRTPEAVAQAVAEEFANAAHEAVTRSGRFSVALAGGNTPRETYLRIAAAELSGAQHLPWDNIHVFFGDERPVPPDNPASNYRMARDSLLSRVQIPAQNVHRIKAELDPEVAAQEYERELRDFFPDVTATTFDLVLLGMGPDGHTASLFPGTAALSEQSRLVVPNWVEKLQQWRITLTLPVFNRSARVLFAAVGTDKASALQQVLAGKPDQYPSQLVKPDSGWLRWIVDENAAQLLPHDLERAG